MRLGGPTHEIVTKTVHKNSATDGRGHKVGVASRDGGV